MSSLRSGMPTPTLTENWDDDFDFAPADYAPSISSSRTTSSSHPKLPAVLQSSHEHGSSESHREKHVIQPKVVESWDDDFDYEPTGWTNNPKAMTEQKAYLERTAPPTLSPALRSMESATSLRAATVSAHQQPSHQKSNSSMSSHSTAHSIRRNRKRSIEFPSQASRSSLNIQRPPLASFDSTSRIGSSRGKSFDMAASQRNAEDASITTRRKSSKDRLSSQGPKEGTFMERVTSIRRRISGSLSTGPSAVGNAHKAAASKAMPPPPVPSSAFRSSSHVNTLPTLGNVVSGLQRVSFDDTRKLKLQKKRQMAPGSFAQSIGQQEDPVSGLPIHGQARGSIDTLSPSQSVGGITTSDSGSAPMFGAESIAGVFTESRAISPASPPVRYPSSSFSSPSPSLASVASHAGSYGFHLPSPAAGSAYNMFGAAFEQSVQRRQVSDSSATSDLARRVSASVRSASGNRSNDRDTEERQKSPKMDMALAGDREGTSQQSAIEGETGNIPPALASRQDTTLSALQARAAVGPEHYEMETSGFPSVAEESAFAPRSPQKAVHVGEVGSPDALSEGKGESSLATFRFGAKPPATSSSAAWLSEYVRPRSPVEPSPLPLPDRSTTGKARLTLRRIGSISRRHSRKISDGWRAVSGHSTSPVKTLASTGPSEVDAKVHRQEVSSGPRPPILSTQKPSDQSSELPRGSAFYGNSPAFETFGRGTSTPPRNAMLSASRPLSMVQPGTSPSGAQLAPTALRSLSQNDSPSTSKIGNNAVEMMSSAPGGLRPEIYPRRNSLGDLKIPSRVVSAQKGLKEEIGAMKQFAAGVQDLKALMAQHTILQAKQERLGITDTSLESEYARWWSLADLLVQLGETGSLDGNSSGGLSNIDNTADIRRERRITLAADKVLPPSHLSQLADDNVTSPASSTIGLVPSLSNSMEIALSTSPSHSSARIGSLWRASTGRNDFSSSQLEQLRAILVTPRLLTIESRGRDEAVGLLQTSGAPVSALSVRADKADTIQGLPRTARNSHPKQSSFSLGPSVDGRKGATSQRKPSRSTMGTIRDFWRGTGDSQKEGFSVTQRNTSTRQQGRPSLGSIFRRSSSRMTVEPEAVDRRMATTKDALNTRTVPATPPAIAVPDDASQSSSVSDWDTPPPVDRPSATIRARPREQRQNPFKSSATNESTITQSDSRKMLAVLGRAHVTSTEGSSTPLSPIRPEFQIPAFSSTSRDSPQLEAAGEMGLTLTPASLPALVSKLRDVTDHCRVHLDAASKLLKERV